MMPLGNNEIITSKATGEAPSLNSPSADRHHVQMRNHE